MRKWVAITGVVLIVAGLLASLDATALLNDSSVQYKVHFSNYGGGMLVSQTIDMTGSDGLLYVSNNSTSLYLIPVSDIQGAAAGNLSRYAIQPSPAGTLTVGGYDFTVSTGEFFANLTGSYALVTYNDNFTSLYYALPGNINHVAATFYGPLLAGGTALWIAGLGLSTYGLLARKKSV
ncbi:MAG: hypothetical protein QXP70_06055 [Methanomassiliicoccales archaeon]